MKSHDSRFFGRNERGRLHAPGEKRMRTGTSEGGGGRAEGEVTVAELARQVLEMQKSIADGYKQTAQAIRDVAHRSSPRSNYLDRRNNQQSGAVFRTPEEEGKLDGRTYTSNQNGTKYTDQFPGMVAENGMVWVNALTTTGENRWALIHMNAVEEGTILADKNSALPRIMIKDDATGEMKPRMMPRPQASEAIVAGYFPSKRKVMAKVKYEDGQGNTYFKDEEIVQMPGFFTSTVWGRDLIPVEDGDRLVRYRKNEYGQYLNRDGMIITMAADGRIELKENYRPVRDVIVKNRDEKGRLIGLSQDGKTLDPSEWKFFVKHPVEDRQIEITKPQFTLSTEDLSKGKVYIEFARNKHGTVKAEDGKLLAFDSAGEVTTVTNDPRDRLNYRFPSIRRIEHYESAVVIRNLLPADELESALKAAAQQAKEKGKKCTEAYEDAYLEKRYKGKLLAKPMWEVNKIEGAEGGGFSNYRYIEDEKFTPVVLEDGIFSHSQQVIVPPTQESVNQQLRRNYYNDGAYAANSKRIFQIEKRDLSQHPLVRDKENKDHQIEYDKPTGRVRSYIYKGKKLLPGSIYENEKGEVCRLVETPDYIYQGNNRRLFEIPLDQNAEGQWVPRGRWMIQKHGDEINSKMADYHPEGYLQHLGGVQNSGASDPFKLKVAWGYGIAAPAFEVIENAERGMKNPETGKSDLIERNYINQTETSYNPAGAPFYRDKMYDAMLTLADDANQLLFQKKADDFATVRQIYAKGVGSTIRKDAYERIRNGILETLGFSGGVDPFGIMKGMGYDTYCQKGTKESMEHHSILQTVYVAPAAATVSGITTTAFFGGGLAVMAAGALAGGLVVSAVVAAGYYHYIYGQSDRRTRWHTQEIIEKNYAPKYIFENKETHVKFLESLRNDLYHWFWDGVGMDQYFHAGGFNAGKDVGNASKHYTAGAGLSVAGALTALTAAAVTSNTLSSASVLSSGLNGLGLGASAAAQFVGVGVTGGATAAACTTIALSVAGIAGAAALGLGAVAAYYKVSSMMIEYSKESALSYAYSDALVSKKLHGKEKEATMGYDYVRHSYAQFIRNFLGREIPPTQQNLLGYLNTTKNSYDRGR